MSYHGQWSQLRVTLARVEGCQVPPVLSRAAKSTSLFALTWDIFTQLLCEGPLSSLGTPEPPYDPQYFVVGMSSPYS